MCSLSGSLPAIHRREHEGIGLSNTLCMRNGTRVALFRCRHFRYGLTDGGYHHTGTRVRQLASFTMHTGLAEQSHTYLLKFSAFPTCYFSLCVSTPGRLGVLEALLSPSPAFRRNFIYTDTAHKPIHAIILHPFTRISSACTCIRSSCPCSTLA